MSITSILPTIALAIYILFMVSLAFKKESGFKHGWIIPAVFSVFFFVFSVIAVINEGSMGFWTELLHNMWGNQIWFDLLFAGSIGWLLIVPEAKVRKMSITLWLLLIITTGCIGFLGMISRLLYLREHPDVK